MIPLAMGLVVCGLALALCLLHDKRSRRKARDKSGPADPFLDLGD